MLEISNIFTVRDGMLAPMEGVKARNVVFGKAVEATKFERVRRRGRNLRAGTKPRGGFMKWAAAF